MEELGDDQVRDLVVDGRTEEDDSLVEKPRVDVEAALAARALLDNHGYEGHQRLLCITSGPVSLLTGVGEPECALADLQAHLVLAALLERLAQHGQVLEQAMPAIVGAVEVEVGERLGARLGRQLGRDEQVACDNRVAARVDVARVQLVPRLRHEGVEHHRRSLDHAEEGLAGGRLLVEPERQFRQQDGVHRSTGASAAPIVHITPAPCQFPPSDLHSRLPSSTRPGTC